MTLEQHYPRELSVVMEMSYSITVKYALATEGYWALEM